MAKRIQRKRTKGWRMPEGAVNVTRPTDWCNPFRVGDGLAAWSAVTNSHERIEVTPDLAVALFRAYIAQQGWERQIREELAGRDLVCWCPLDQPCHADVLLDLANREHLQASEQATAAASD